MVGLISYLKTRGDNTSAKGYFLAGRRLSAIVIGFSMVLTSLSTEQLIGTNGSSYISNFSIMAWTVQSVIPLCVLALCLLPRYLRGGFTTIPEFFEERYDKRTRQLTSLLFLIGYALVLIPGALYSGAIAFIQIFDMTKIFDINFSTALWIVVWSIGIIGSLYAIFGGLKGVAVSDTLNGFALLVGGTLIPFFALKYLGHGNLFEGIQTITTIHYEKLNAWGGVNDPVPWTTVFTGIMIVNFFYWGTNQAIIQRALGAKNLAEGQKGILIAGFFLLMLPGMLHLPGVISFHIFGDSIENIDLVYPNLVEDVLPKPLLGFFVACLFGAILSTFNSFVNSASTLFCYDIYRPIFNRDISEEKLIKIAKLSGLIIALISMCVAPMLQYGTEGLFLLLRKFAGFFNIPIIVLVAVGFLNKTISGIAARTVIFIHMLLYFSLVWIIKIEINFVHVMGGLFVFDILLMYILGLFFKRKIPYELSKKNQSNVSLKGWKYAHQATYLLILGLIYMYVIFSPFGLAGGKSVKNISLIFLIMAITGFCAVSKIKMVQQIQENTLINKA